MCYGQEQTSKTEKFILSVIGLVLGMTVGSLMVRSCSAQQPNHANAFIALLLPVSNYVAPYDGQTGGGPFLWNCPATPTSAALHVAGLNCRAFEIWGHTSAPLLNGGISTSYGICDLDPQQTWGLITSGTFLGCGGTPGQQSWFYGFTTPAASTAWSMQGWMADPTHPAGIRLSAAVCLFN